MSTKPNLLPSEQISEAGTLRFSPLVQSQLVQNGLNLKWFYSYNEVLVWIIYTSNALGVPKSPSLHVTTDELKLVQAVHQLPVPTNQSKDSC